MGACVFCDSVPDLVHVVGGTIYEDAHVYARHFYSDEWPTYLGHLMIMSKRHAPSFAELTDADAQAVGLLIARLSRALKACTQAEHVYAVFYGEVVPHVHVHVMARYSDTPSEYLRWNVEDWPAAPRGGPQEIEALCDRLRTYLRAAS
jgi:histidine triad (HIT) family protein